MYGFLAPSHLNYSLCRAMPLTALYCPSIVCQGVAFFPSPCLLWPLMLVMCAGMAAPQCVLEQRVLVCDAGGRAA